MPRSIYLSVSKEMADSVLRRVRDMNGVVGLGRQPGASLDPPGDVLVVHTTNDSTRPVFEALNELGVASQGSILMTAPSCLISRGHQTEIGSESNETVWEEMSFLLMADTNVGFNFLALMFLAGGLAGAGILSGSVHVVIGAMVIAPAFEPLVRIPFGLVAGEPRLTIRGLRSAVYGYLMVAPGAMSAALIAAAFDGSFSPGADARPLLRFWSTFTRAEC